MFSAILIYWGVYLYMSEGTTISVREYADLYEISITTVRRRIRSGKLAATWDRGSNRYEIPHEAGTEVVSAGIMEARAIKYAELWASGENHTAIARALGIDRKSLSNYLELPAFWETLRRHSGDGLELLMPLVVERLGAAIGDGDLAAIKLWFQATGRLVNQSVSYQVRVEDSGGGVKSAHERVLDVARWVKRRGMGREEWISCFDDA